jgi:hypothetical protein
MKYLRLLKQVEQIKARNVELFVKNIILRCDIETIAEDPESGQAKKIIARYRLEIDKRKEREQASQN